MTNILFVCHGNICRSPTAEFLMKEIVKKAGLDDEFHIASAATSTEELGNGVYPPSRKLLNAYGIDCSAKRARQITSRDYQDYDYLIGMDRYNGRNMRRWYGDDPAGKICNLLDFAGRTGEEVADPWYSGEFELTWKDVMDGCAGLLKELHGITVLDFSLCTRKDELYKELRRKMGWKEWYGDNLDALWDVLTGLEHEGTKFVIMPPFPNAGEGICSYVNKIEDCFKEAGKLC